MKKKRNMNKKLKLLVWGIFVLSLGSIFSSMSWFFSLLEHLQLIYFILAFIVCVYFIFKKNTCYIILSLVCACLSFLPAFLLLQGVFFHSPELQVTRQVFVHNVHNGNDEKGYIKQLNTSPELNVFLKLTTK